MPGVLHDMHGNVKEWLQDCWHENYEGAPNDGSAWTVRCYGYRTPEGYNDEKSKRVVRGGSWATPYASALRSAYRSSYSRTHRRGELGFRLAQDL